MKKIYFSPVTRYVDLSTESPLLDISMPKSDDSVGYDDVLTKNHSIWDNWSDDNL